MRRSTGGPPTASASTTPQLLLQRGGSPPIGLIPRVTPVEDDEGSYLYLHQGHYLDSPKHNAVFALRPSVGSDARANAEVYWMEKDPMADEVPDSARARQGNRNGWRVRDGRRRV